MYRRIVFASAQGVSFADASESLAELCDLKLLPKRVWRAAQRIGSEVHAEDPCPTLPAAFADPGKMREIARETKGFTSESQVSLKAG